MEYSVKLRNSSEKFKTQAKNSKTQAKNSRFWQIHLVKLPKTGPISKPELNTMFILQKVQAKGIFARAGAYT